MLIKSLIDLDFYKLTMAQVVLLKFPNVKVKYEFKCRTSNAKLGLCASEIREEINKLKNLQLTDEEYKYLQTIPFLKFEFINWLKRFKFNPQEEIFIDIFGESLQLSIQTSWLQGILYETMILGIIENIASRIQMGFDSKIVREEGLINLHNQIELIKDLNDPQFKFADFGTRRRLSFEWQDEVVNEFNKTFNIILKTNNFVGTSNVYLAMKHGIKPVGTMAHEMLMGAQALFPIPNFQNDMFNVWADVYDGNLGIALTDTISSEYFFKTFGLKLSKLFDGVRHDSGDPIKFAKMTINHYKSLGIDPMTKTIVFSDGLTVEDAISIYNIFKNQIKMSFGIGTSLTHNFKSIKPVSIVIKLQEVNGFPVVKISDEPKKAMCPDDKFLEFMKNYFNKGD